MPRPPDSDRGPPLYWRLMSVLDRHFGSFTSAALTDLAGTGHRHTVEAYLAFLRSEGIVSIVSSNRNGACVEHHYTLARKGEAPPLRRSAGADMGLRQQALWTAMRSLPTFSPAELAMAASTEALTIPADTARSYVFDLKHAGLLHELAPRTYRLLPARNSGPRAPIVLREQKAVFDVNTMRTVKVTARPLNQGRAA